MRTPKLNLKTLLFTLSIFFPVTIFAQAATIQQVTDYYQKEKNFSGVVLVATNGHIDYLKGMGLADRQSELTLNAKSRFKIASVTKTFTAVLVMQMAEQGKIDLNATIGTYLPGYHGEARDKVTILQLLTYSSGLPNCETVGGDTIYKVPVSTDEFIARYSSGRLQNKPGATFNYDNGDYIILGRILEKISGKSFDDLLKQQILEPLHMSNTGTLTSRDIITGMAHTYTYDDSTRRFFTDQPYYIENFFSAGAMYSTAEDLLLFDQAIYSEKLLSKKTLQIMLTPYPALGNVAIGFWEASKYGPIDSKFYYRPGGIYGATANWIHVIDSAKTFIILSNTSATNLFEMTQQLYLVAKGRKGTIPVVADPAASAGVSGISSAAGTWTIDLRPGPKSEVYLKDFIITPTGTNTFSGEFYGSHFDSGQMNAVWGPLYFGFTTSDRNNVYYHSGVISGDSISGVSFSADRKFISHWTGVKARK